MTPPLTVRRGSAADAEALAHLAARTFLETYRDSEAVQDLADYAAEHFQVPVIGGLLGDPRCTTLLAESGPHLAGYAVLRDGSAPPCVTGEQPLQLERFYLGAEATGRGEGTRFLRAVTAEARTLGARTLWLGVYHRNARAIRFYESRGFRQIGERDFPFGGTIFVDPVYAVAVEQIRFPSNDARDRREVLENDGSR
jgi:ribosomal protein S18 acetylase RimI-like enzyme